MSYPDHYSEYYTKTNKINQDENLRGPKHDNKVRLRIGQVINS